VRFQAVIAFARVAPDEAWDSLTAAFGDADPSIRHIAVRCAEERAFDSGEPMPAAMLDAMPPLLDDPDAPVRVAAAIVLARSGEARARAILIDVARGTVVTGEAEDEAGAVELLGELGVRDAIPHLERRAFGFLGLGEGRFSWQAMVALAK